MLGITQVDGCKLFGTTTGVPASAKAYNRLVLDVRLKGWGVKDAAHRTLISGFCHHLCQPEVRVMMDISSQTSLLIAPQVCAHARVYVYVCVCVCVSAYVCVCQCVCVSAYYSNMKCTLHTCIMKYEMYI